jgi:hypothetical protein
MYLSRGNPVVYSGDEQGFTGAGNDKSARQDTFASRDAEYDNLDNDVGGRQNDAGFEQRHRLRRHAGQRQLRPDPPAVSDDRGAASSNQQSLRGHLAPSVRTASATDWARVATSGCRARLRAPVSESVVGTTGGCAVPLPRSWIRCAK